MLAEELLDSDAGSPQEVASALRSLRWVNRFFGGNRVHQKLLSTVWRVAGAGRLHILEVACGHAEALKSALLRMRVPAARLQITLSDRSAQHFPPAAEWPDALPRPELLTADALRLPLPDRSVDVVSSCLFFHHLDEQQACLFLEEALRVARVAVVINDLERQPLHYALSRAFSLVDPSRLSRHDGPASVRQAYTQAELRALLAKTGKRFEVTRGYLFRVGAILWV